MQSGDPRLTLVMPVYNVGESVRLSIESYLALEQEAEIPVELIMVDDASTDNSVEWLQHYLQDLPSVTMLKSPANSGPGAARNRALEIIRHGYIGFIDADDQLLSSTYLQVLQEGIDSGAEWITFNGEVVSGEQVASRYDLERLTDDNELMVRRCMRGEFDGSVIFSIYAVTLINRLQLRFPTGIYEDIPFAYSAMLLAHSRHQTMATAYRKINRIGSIVNTISSRHIDGMLNACLRVRKQVIDHQLSRYGAFEDDFGYGLFGYVDTLLQAIVRPASSVAEKLALMDVLYQRYRQIPEFSGVMERNSSDKDRVVSRYLWCWSHNREKEQFIHEYQQSH